MGPAPTLEQEESTMPDRFPQEAALRDGRRVYIRRFENRDADALHEFFSRLPNDVRRFAWDDITDRKLVDSWAANIDYGKVLPVVAFDGERIVADATLHRRKGGPLRLVGRIKWLLDPEFRGVGLGTVLANDLISIARTEGLKHVSCMLVRDLEPDSIATLTELGFESYVQPGYGTDPDGKQHDMVKMVLKL